MTVFIVEQDVRSSLELADTAYVMENGRIVQTGPAAKLLDDPSIKEAYLGLWGVRYRSSWRTRSRRS